MRARSTVGWIVDFYVLHRNRNGDVNYGIVIDAQDKQTLQLEDIDQIVHYSQKCRADERVIYVARKKMPFSDAARCHRQSLQRLVEVTFSSRLLPDLRIHLQNDTEDYACNFIHKRAALGE
jgi:hypothetical protein